MRTEGVSSLEKLSLLFELSRSFSSLIELEELLPYIIAKTKEVLQAESCSLLLLDQERQELYFPVISDASPEIEARVKGIRFPADKGIAGWVLQHGMPTRVTDVARDDRWYGEVDRSTGEQTRDLLYAPLRTRRGVIGVIGLRNKQVETFSEDDLLFLEALAGAIAVAMENASLYRQVRQSEARLKEEVATLQREIVHRQRFEEIIGTGSAMAKVFTLMESAIPSPITVLLEGRAEPAKSSSPGPFIITVHARRGPSSRSTAALCRTPCSRASCSAIAKGPLPERSWTSRGFLKRPMAGRCSWMRSARPVRPCRSSSCAFCRRERSGASERRSRGV